MYPLDLNIVVSLDLLTLLGNSWMEVLDFESHELMLSSKDYQRDLVIHFIIIMFWVFFFWGL